MEANPGLKVRVRPEHAVAMDERPRQFVQAKPSTDLSSEPMKAQMHVWFMPECIPGSLQTHAFSSGQATGRENRN